MDKEYLKDAIENLVFGYFEDNDKYIHDCYTVDFGDGKRYSLNFDFVKL